MTNNIAKIRAALEQAGYYISSDLASERGAFEGYEGVSRIDEIKADLANNSAALAALAELEKAAAPQFVAGEVTEEMCQRVAASFYGADTFANGVEMHEALQLWRKELGPALGLVEIREPTPGECARICNDALEQSDGVNADALGRTMFDAVSKWLKGEL